MNIRLAKLSDYDKLMDLYNLFVKTDKYLNPNNDSFKSVFENSNSFIYVAEENKKLIGLATMSLRYVVRYAKPILQLEELFVLEEHRKKGIGKKFVEILLEKAKELKCRSIYIESRIELTPAHQFYENLGYKKNGYYFKKDL